MRKVRDRDEGRVMLTLRETVPPPHPNAPGCLFSLDELKQRVCEVLALQILQYFAVAELRFVLKSLGSGLKMEHSRVSQTG